jgi:two-component system cell cycle sensor histidine kinase/response regulator CckA
VARDEQEAGASAESLREQLEERRDERLEERRDERLEDRRDEQLREQRALLDGLPFATAVRDRDGRFLYANAAAAAGYGVTHQAMIGKTEQELLPAGNDAQAVLDLDRQVIDAGRSATVPGQRFVTPEGRRMVLHVTREPVRFCGVQAVLVTALDVTDTVSAVAERRHLERRLAETQRLDGLGLMAVGVAHDFNNLLVGVLANADMGLRDAAEGTRLRTALERIKAAAGRLAGLTRQLLTYSGRGPVEFQSTDLAALTRELLDLLASSLPATIQVELAVADELPRFDCDEAQLSQVVINLVINAAEAMADRPGTIRIGLGREVLDSARTASLTVRSVRGATDFLCLDVSDDGAGMDEATRNRMFDPFFSTKGAMGRGLGLAAVLGVVRAHQGALQVDSTPRVGTRVRAWFPLTQPRPRRGQPAVPNQAALEQRQVLVVDDEPSVREVTCALLEAHGFKAHPAADGQAALDATGGHGPFAAVVLDMTMPGLSVSDTHRGLREALGVDVPILLTSGYTEPDLIATLCALPGTAFLEKPFDIQALVARLNSLLG